MTYQPSLEVRRQQLTQAREQFRQKGYAFELDIEALMVQDEGDDSIAEQVKQAEHSRDNCYKAARRMDELLRKLPKPSPDPATRKK